MKGPRLERPDPATLRFVGLPAFFADNLLQLDEILARRDRPGTARRIFPAPTDDAGLNAEWADLVVPELRHLFAAAAETVRRDLAALEPEPRRRIPTFRVAFPAEHASAWMSALNEARLILGEEHGLTEEDLNRPVTDLEDAKQLARARVWACGWLLELLVEAAGGD